MLSRNQQHRAFQRGMTLYELKLRVQAGAARNAFLRKAATAYEDHTAVPAHLYQTHRARVQATLGGHYTATAGYFGKLALMGLKSGRKAALTPIEALMADWVKREALKKAKMIADTDQSDVVDIIGTGITEGLGTAEIATRIRKLTGLTPYKASLIARTETHVAATYGSIESVRDAESQLDVKMLKAWLPTNDARTRPEHAAMAGSAPIPLDEKFLVGGEEMDRPGDPNASAGNVVNCLHPDSVIESGRIKAMTRHWYEGKLVSIKTASGNEVSVTPNHPILTREGWVPAAALKKGGCVISGHGFERPNFHGLDVKNIEITAEKLYDSLAVIGMVVRVAGVAVDFHGEVPKGDVDIVNTTSKLGHRFITALGKPFNHLRLTCTDLGQGRLLALRLLHGIPVEEFTRKLSHFFVGFCSDLLSTFRVSIGHAGVHAFAAIALGNAVVSKAKVNVIAISPKRFGKCLDRFPLVESSHHFETYFGPILLRTQPARIGVCAQRDTSTVESMVNRLLGNAVKARKLNHAPPRFVFSDKVVCVEHNEYRGFVYNAETHNGYYICNGIVQHNCRCSLIFEEQQ